MLEACTEHYLEQQVVRQRHGGDWARGQKIWMLSAAKYALLPGYQQEVKWCGQCELTGFFFRVWATLGCRIYCNSLFLRLVT